MSPEPVEAGPGFGAVPEAMRAARVHAFGGPEVIAIEHIAVPACGADEVLVEVGAAGVGPWDAWIRSGRSVLPQPLPLTLGSDVAGVVRAVGSGVTHLRIGDRAFGVTNARFTGGYAEWAACSAAMVAAMPASLSIVEAASVPVVAVSAWQLLFEAAEVSAGDTVLVHGAAGNVGGYVVQLALGAGIAVFVTSRDGPPIRAGAAGGSGMPGPVRADAAIDLVGGESQSALFQWVRRGGRLISLVSTPDAERAAAGGIDARFLLVNVTRSALERLADLFRRGALTTRVGVVLPLEAAREAHAMLDGVTPHQDGKIVLVCGRS